MRIVLCKFFNKIHVNLKDKAILIGISKFKKVLTSERNGEKEYGIYNAVIIASLSPSLFLDFLDASAESNAVR